MKKYLILIVCALILGLPSATKAQTLVENEKTPLSRTTSARAQQHPRTITIYQYKIDPITQTRTLVGQWPWLNRQSYSRFQSEFILRPSVEARILSKFTPSGTFYMVTETDDKNNLLKQTTFANGIISRTHIERRENLYFDTQELWKYLATQRQNILQKNTLPPTLHGALMIVRSSDPTTGKPVLWPIKTQEDVLYIASYLRNIRPLTPVETLNIAADFDDDPNAFHIERHSPEFKDIPMLFDVNNYQIRIVTNIPHTLYAYDRPAPATNAISFEQQLLGQKKLYNDLQAKGQSLPQPVY